MCQIEDIKYVTLQWKGFNLENVENTRLDVIPSGSYHKMLEKPNMHVDIIRREA
jgi:hypothetical protein